jgi:hypothetical protein
VGAEDGTEALLQYPSACLQVAEHQKMNFNEEQNEMKKQSLGRIRSATVAFWKNWNGT